MNNQCKDCQLYLQCIAQSTPCEIVFDITKFIYLDNSDLKFLTSDLRKKLNKRLRLYNIETSGSAVNFSFNDFSYRIFFYSSFNSKCQIEWLSNDGKLAGNKKYNAEWERI